jgi:hypothetical protein
MEDGGGGQTALRWGRPNCGFGSDRGAFRLGDYQVGPQGGSRCMGRLEVVCSGGGHLNPCVEHVAASDLSRSVFLG